MVEFIDEPAYDILTSIKSDGFFVRLKLTQYQPQGRRLDDYSGRVEADGRAQAPSHRRIAQARRSLCPPKMLGAFLHGAECAAG
jgi:hypothetical protein